MVYFIIHVPEVHCDLFSTGQKIRLKYSNTHPYYRDGYSFWDLTMAQHKQLSHLLNKHKGDFIFFCRLTERSHNESYESPMLRAFITDMYASFEHYFMDIQTRDGLERVITNFQFDGGTPYTAEADAIKMKADAQKEEDAEQNLSSDEKGGDSDEK